MRGTVLLAFVMSGFVAIGCGDSLRTLSQADVEGIPPGDATGSLFAGRYMLTRAWKDACQCRVGSCSTLTININVGTLNVVQADGAFSSSNELNPTLLCEGGIDSDGQFVCGQVASDPPIVSFSLTTGQIALANGQPASISGTSETTTLFPGFECDIRIGFAGTFVGP